MGRDNGNRKKKSPRGEKLTVDTYEVPILVPLTDSKGEVREMTKADAHFFKRASEALPLALIKRLSVTPSEKSSGAELAGCAAQRPRKLS
ncbi:hypothetical protein [Caballeronia sp. LZ001]|uniref:hypothetical protein n=1 Tax=Caballeronia sp. LZ001 TaxID=3038553 RepID=UPI00285DFE33|nr:hypothetical protein [Caballeronia sp. LZ001]MDR5802588.1 hypothetical protein [Caballeronia sp. LZ001]